MQQFQFEGGGTQPVGHGHQVAVAILGVGGHIAQSVHLFGHEVDLAERQVLRTAIPLAGTQVKANSIRN